MQEKTRRAIQRACDIIDLCIALAVGLGLLVSFTLPKKVLGLTNKDYVKPLFFVH